MSNACRSSTRTSLLGRVKVWEDQESWETFSKIYRPLIHSFSVKSGLTQDEAQDVAQETLIEVACRIKNQEYDRNLGPFRAWLYRLTKWRVTNQFQKRRHDVLSLEQAEMGDGEALERLESPSDETSTIWEENWRQVLFDAAMERLRQKMKPKHYQVFHAVIRQGLPVAQVAQVLHMNCSQVYLIKLRGVVQLKKQMARLEKAQT